MKRRTPAPARAARRLAPLAVGVAALGLTGCQVLNPVQTDKPYQPADGVSVDLDTVQVRNLVVISDAKGSPGTVSGSVVNNSGQSVTVSIAGQGGADATVDVPAYTQEQLSEKKPVRLSTVDVAPGSLATLQLSSNGSGTNVVQVPVLPADGYYATLKPGSESSSSPSVSVSSSPTVSGDSTPTPTATNMP